MIDMKGKVAVVTGAASLTTGKADDWGGPGLGHGKNPFALVGPLTLETNNH